MKKLLLLLLLLFSCMRMFAQGPPPPAIFSVPKQEDLKEFVPEDKRFKITFGGIPNLEKQDKIDYQLETYKVVKNACKSIVVIREYKRNVEKNKDEILADIKQNILNLPNNLYTSEFPKTEIKDEKVIKIGKYKGIEFNYLHTYNFYKIRILFVGKRVYEITNHATNWHILSDYNKEKVEAFHKETERFFSSFQILEK